MGKKAQEWKDKLHEIFKDEIENRGMSLEDNSSEPARKRQFLNYILQNPTVNGKKLYFTIASPFNLVLELSDSPNWLRTLDDVRKSLGK